MSPLGKLVAEAPIRRMDLFSLGLSAEELETLESHWRDHLARRPERFPLPGSQTGEQAA